MIINKVTTGFVIQSFDTDEQMFISQSFVAGYPVEYEDAEGNRVDDEEMAKVNFGPLASEEPYLPFAMVQPD